MLAQVMPTIGGAAAFLAIALLVFLGLAAVAVIVAFGLALVARRRNDPQLAAAARSTALVCASPGLLLAAYSAVRRDEPHFFEWSGVAIAAVACLVIGVVHARAARQSGRSGNGVSVAFTVVWLVVLLLSITNALAAQEEREEFWRKYGTRQPAASSGSARPDRLPTRRLPTVGAEK